MSNEVLNSLLKEYEQKKLNAELEAEKRKNELYKKIPKLQEIENELNNYAISTAKNILFDNKYSLDELNQKIKILKYEKKCILEEEGYSNNYLKPIYECDLCNDTGYIINQSHKTQMCNCLKQKLLDVSFNKSNISKTNKENFENFNENLFSDEVDLAKYHFNISPKENIKQIKNKCIEFIENFENVETKNLLFTGNAGLR